MLVFQLKWGKQCDIHWFSLPRALCRVLAVTCSHACIIPAARHGNYSVLPSGQRSPILIIVKGTVHAFLRQTKQKYNTHTHDSSVCIGRCDVRSLTTHSTTALWPMSQLWWQSYACLLSDGASSLFARRGYNIAILSGLSEVTNYILETKRFSFSPPLPTQPPTSSTEKTKTSWLLIFRV